MTQQSQTPEQELAAYWRNQAAIKQSDFDTLEPIPLADDRTLQQVKSELAVRIFRGLPLTEQEYYLARAFHFLLADVPYTVFFMNHWHESVEHRSYKSLHDCEFCRDPRGKKLRGQAREENDAKTDR
jgi:hypothetical protein